MNIEKVIQELKETGFYKRGDCEVSFSVNSKRFEVYAKYKVKRGYQISSLNLHGLSIQKFNDEFHLSSHATSLRNALKPITIIINSIRYPDRHITRRAGCFIEIRDGKVTKIGKPKLECCPLAQKMLCGSCTQMDIKEGMEKRIEKGAFREHRCIDDHEAKVLFGASEMIADAMRDKKLDAAVLVCEGAGTVIVDAPEVAQGIGATMTGVFYTSPIRKLIERLEESAYVLFPETAEINQVEGTKVAKELGHEKIATTLAAGSARKLKDLKKIEGVTALALCTTGIKRREAYEIREYADLAWACASKYVRELVGPSSYLQVGTTIPVFALTKLGLELISARIKKLDKKLTKSLEGLEFNKKYHLGHYNDTFYIEQVKELPVTCEKAPSPLI